MTSSRSVPTSNRMIQQPHSALHFTSSRTSKHYFRAPPKWGDPAECRAHANLRSRRRPLSCPTVWSGTRSRFSASSTVLVGGPEYFERYRPLDHALTLDPLLLTVHGRFNAARGARIFPCPLAERGTGGLLLLQGRQRLSEPQQGVRSFRRFIEFGGHAKERFRSVTVLLALEETLAQPVLGICHQGIAGVFLREAAHRR